MVLELRHLAHSLSDNKISTEAVRYKMHVGIKTGFTHCIYHLETQPCVVKINTGGGGTESDQKTVSGTIY